MSGFPLGVNTFSWLWSRPARETLARLADLGYTRFEAMLSPPHLWPAGLDAAARREFKRFLDGRGLRIVSLNPPSLDQNLASPMAEMREHTVGLFRAAIELAQDWEVPHVVTITGRLHPLLPAPRADALGWLRQGLERLRPHAQRAGVSLALENVPMGALPRAEDLGAFIEEEGGDDLSVCWDVANAQFAGENPAQGLLRVAKRVRLIHLSDTGSHAWRHDPVGRGDVPFHEVAEAIRRIGYEGISLMEIISPNPEPDIADSHRRLQALGWAPLPIPSTTPPSATPPSAEGKRAKG